MLIFSLIFRLLLGVWLVRGERVVSVSDVVNNQGVVGHTETLGDFLLVFLMVAALAYLMYKWEIEWRDPVKRRAMLTLNGIRHLGRR